MLCGVQCRDVIETETRLVSSRASTSALNCVSTDLDSRAKQAMTDKEVLSAKYQKIQHFNKLTVVSHLCVSVVCGDNRIM